MSCCGGLFEFCQVIFFMTDSLEFRVGVFGSHSEPEF